MYPSEFSLVHVMKLESTFPTYFQDVKNNVRFFNLDEISGVGKRMVDTRKYWHILYLFTSELAMLLPVVTAGVKRVFYAINNVKTKNRNRICDEWLNDLLLAYVERYIF